MRNKKPQPRSARAVERYSKVHRLLKGARVPVPVARIAEELECSERVVYRLIDEMRKHLRAPIEYRREYPSGYRYTDAAFETPGLGWLTSEECESLLLLHEQLKHAYPGLLDKAIEPIRRVVVDMLHSQGITVANHSRFRFLHFAARHPGRFLGAVVHSVSQRQRMFIHYVSRDDGKRSQREISPQRLTHYRHNWYLDAMCHDRKSLRTFSVDCIESAETRDTTAIDIAEAMLDRELGASYGIFAGMPTATAILKFTPRRARWVAPEQWHPDQKSRFTETGHYILEVPFARPEELILDIMRYGADVEVIAPLALRQAVAERHRAAADQYR